VWDAHTLALLGAFDLPANTMNLFHLTFSGDGNRIATTAASREREALVNVWGSATLLQVSTETREKGSITFCVAFDPTGRYLVREGPGHTVQVREAASGEVKGVIGRHDLQIWAIRFSPDGRRLATASNDGTVRLWLWDPTHLDREQQPQRTFPVRVDGYGNRVAFGFDGHTLATGGEGFAVQVWDTETHAPPRTLAGHTEDVFAVAFSPDGRWLASAGADTTVRVWDVATWKLRHTLRGHTGLVMTLAFSPDSRSLASGSRDHLMKVWDTTQWSEAPPPAQIPAQSN
jgi:WD40 repeat protein